MIGVKLKMENIPIHFAFQGSMSLMILLIGMVRIKEVQLVKPLAWGRCETIYACGHGIDYTRKYLKNEACSNSNKVKDHWNIVVNSYYQKKGEVSGSCNFLGMTFMYSHLCCDFSINGVDFSKWSLF